MTYNVITGDVIRLAPRTHNPRVVARNHGNNVHALLLQLGKVLDVAWEMVGRAAGGEGTWDILEVSMHDSFEGIGVLDRRGYKYGVSYREQQTRRPSCRPTAQKPCTAGGCRRRLRSRIPWSRGRSC